jgi:hypothetical protein
MWIQTNPIPAIRAALITYFELPSARTLFSGTVRVTGEEIPENWSLNTDPPLLTVHDDGGPTIYPIKRDPTIRLTARARGKLTAVQVIAHADGYLRANVGAAGLAHIRSGGSAFVVARDTVTGADMASATLPAAVLMTNTT